MEGEMKRPGLYKTTFVPASEPTFVPVTRNKKTKNEEKNVVPARPTASIPAKKRTFEESSSVVEDDIFEGLSPIISLDEFTCDSYNYLLNLKGPTPNYEKEKEVPKLNAEDGPREAFKPLPPRRISTNSTTNEPKAPSKGEESSAKKKGKKNPSWQSW